MRALVRRSESGRDRGRVGRCADDLKAACAFPNMLSAYQALHRLAPPNRTSASIERRKQHTIIEARAELGPGHALFVRGEGDGLSWRKGTPLVRVDPGTWTWESERLQEKVIFQLLLDDQIWARGEDIVLEAGRRIELAPEFEWPEIPRTC